MSRTRTADAEYVSLTADDMARFHRNAPAALARRGGAFLMESLAGSLELVAMGAVPIVGMLWFDWSAAQLLAFLLVGAWVGIVCDWARLTLAERGVKEFGESHYNDWHVWVVVEALRAGRTTAPRSHVRAKHDPWSGVFVDIAAGGMGTAVIAGLLWQTRMQGEGFAGFADRSWAIGLLGMAAYQVGSAAWDIVRHRRLGAMAGPVEAQPGVRGIGLFLLVFVMLTVGDPDKGDNLAAQRVMLTVNGAIVVVGVLNSAAMLWLWPETNWLRKYISERPREVEVAPETPGKKRKARRR